MKDIRKTYPPTFKVKVVLGALKEEKTPTELASQYRFNPSQISTWKMKAKKGLLEVFKEQRSKKSGTEKRGEIDSRIVSSD